MQEKKIEFVQIFKNIISLFYVKNKNNNKKHRREIKTSEITASDFKVCINFSALELDAYDLKILLTLVAIINMDRENLKILEMSENKNIIFINKLNFKLEPNLESDLSKIVNYETSWSKLLSWFKSSYQTNNIKILKTTLELLQSSIVHLTIKDKETDKNLLDLTSRLLAFEVDTSPEDRKNRIILIFNPLFYLVAFGKAALKTTINMEVFQKLFGINANMSVVYCILCDKVNFGEEKKFTIKELELTCYGNIAKDKRTKSKRRKFLLKTLEEIEKLSERSFIIKIDEKKGKVKIKRTPDRKQVKKSSKPKETKEKAKDMQTANL